MLDSDRECLKASVIVDDNGFDAVRIVIPWLDRHPTDCESGPSAHQQPSPPRPRRAGETRHSADLYRDDRITEGRSKRRVGNSSNGLESSKNGAWPSRRTASTRQARSGALLLATSIRRDPSDVGPGLLTL